MSTFDERKTEIARKAELLGIHFVYGPVASGDMKFSFRIDPGKDTTKLYPPTYWRYFQKIEDAEEWIESKMPEPEEFVPDTSEDTGFRALIARYADSRTICNCGEAYEDSEGRCRYGCSTNQILAKYELATRALEEIEILESETVRIAREAQQEVADIYLDHETSLKPPIR